MNTTLAKLLHRIGTNKTLILLLGVAAFVRLWAMPAPEGVRDSDEIGYVANGLQAWEGLSPGWGSTPSGPQTWMGWLYAAGRSGWQMLHQWRDKTVPLTFKPYFAVDQALFELYEDLSGLRRLLLLVSLGVALAGVYGCYRLGLKYGGAAGAVVAGGLAALLPLFVEYAAFSKSCSDGWMLALLAIASAALLRGPSRCWVPGVLLGLAVSSRLDMVAMTPLVLWALWDSEEQTLSWKPMLSLVVLMSTVALLSAPFAFQGFLGILRQVGLSRVVGYDQVTSPRLTTLRELAWEQGLGPMLLATVLAVVLSPPGKRFKRFTLAGIAALGLSTMFIGHYTTIRYHGAPILACLVCAFVCLGALFERWPKAAMALALALVLLPAVQSVRVARDLNTADVREQSTQWVDQHVPAGTIVYLHPGYIAQAILPTEASADALWGVVNGESTWRSKVQDGFHRFALPKGPLPRALSEDNLVKDRALCRRWFILGGGRSPRPRFDVRLVPMSVTFGPKVDTLSAAFHQTGGVVVWRTGAYPMPPPEMGEPVIKWVNAKGAGTLVFVSPDVRAKLK